MLMGCLQLVSTNDGNGINELICNYIQRSLLSDVCIPAVVCIVTLRHNHL